MKRLLAIFAFQVLLMAPLMWAQEGHAATEAEGHGESHEEGPGGPNATLWKTVNFILFAGAGIYFLRKPASAFFAGRNKAILEGMDTASAKERDAQQRLAAVEAKLSGLETELAQLRKSAEVEMERDRQRIEAGTVASIERLQEHAAAEMESARAAAKNELSRHAAVLALNLAEQRITAETQSPETRQRLLAQAIRKLGDASGATRN